MGEHVSATRRKVSNLVLVGVVLSGMLAGCSGGGNASSNPPAAVASPTPDAVTTKYVALVHKYWIQYVTARADGALVCYDAAHVDPPKCQVRAAAILAVHEQFLSDLDAAPPPSKFAADDQAFRTQLPKAIEHVKAMVSASESGDKQAVFQATELYVGDMIPIVTNALDHVDPSVIHD